MVKRKKSKQWAARQNRDAYVRAARADGFRARSAYKLEEVDRKYHLIKRGKCIVDLGAAPGGWSQYAARRIGDKGSIVAVDILPMQAVEMVRFVRGDFNEAATVEAVVAEVAALSDAGGDGARAVDLVLSDLAPNLTGTASTDQANMEALQESVLQFCRRCLRPGGALLTKLFAGESEPVVRARFDDCFAKVQIIKPSASRAASREMYLLGRGFVIP